MTNNCVRVYPVLCFSLFLVAVVVITTLDFSSDLLDGRESHHPHQKEEFTFIDPDSVEPCTFEELQESFAGASSLRRDQHDQKESQNSKEPQCWSLEQQILRVPAARVVNRDNMPKLGHGCLGGVYKAVLELNSRSRKSSHRHPSHSYYCTAALKTDDCYYITDNPWKDSCKHTNSHSCVSSDARAQWNYQTYLGGEYLGALPWYAQLQTKQFQKGLLPTWAIVTDEDHPMKHWLPRKPFTTSLPHPDPTMKGILMPLVKEMEYFNENVTLPPLELVTTVLPAAKGLAFLFDMGLSAQDLRGNMALTRDSNHTPYYAIIYDNSFMGLDPSAGECHATAKDGSSKTTWAACQFCHEPGFPKAQRQKATLRGHNAVESEVIRFRDIILEHMETAMEDTENAALAEELEHALQDQSLHSAHDVVRILENFLAAHQ